MKLATREERRQAAIRGAATVFVEAMARIESERAALPPSAVMPVERTMRTQGGAA